jgi:hypothetical protein
VTKSNLSDTTNPCVRQAPIPDSFRRARQQEEQLGMVELIIG